MLVFTGLMWFVPAALYLLGSGANQRDNELVAIFGIGTLVLTVACGGIVLWRIRLIRRVFARGVVVKGWVAHVGKDDGGEYTPQDKVVYRYGGREYELWTVNKRVLDRENFAVGEAVEVMVDPDKPSRAFLCDHFFGKESFGTTDSSSS